jgi:hypothetical protein
VGSSATTVVAPEISAPSSSVVPSMKLIELFATRTSSRSRDHAVRAHANRFARARWVPMTPFGRPVLPEV